MISSFGVSHPRQHTLKFTFPDTIVQFTINTNFNKLIINKYAEKHQLRCENGKFRKINFEFSGHPYVL